MKTLQESCIEIGKKSARLKFERLREGSQNPRGLDIVEIAVALQIVFDEYTPNYVFNMIDQIEQMEYKHLLAV